MPWCHCIAWCFYPIILVPYSTERGALRGFRRSGHTNTLYCLRAKSDPIYKTSLKHLLMLAFLFVFCRQSARDVYPARWCLRKQSYMKILSVYRNLSELEYVISDLDSSSACLFLVSPRFRSLSVSNTIFAMVHGNHAKCSISIHANLRTATKNYPFLA